MEHGMWWRPNESGYTTELREAGVYPEADARRILDATRRRPLITADDVTEALIPLDCVRPRADLESCRGRLA